MLKSKKGLLEGNTYKNILIMVMIVMLHVSINNNDVNINCLIMKINIPLLS